MTTKTRSKELKVPKYAGLTLDEAVRLIVCVALDVTEYVVPILLVPLTGDMLDAVGFVIGIILFGWLGLISLLEFVPLADYFPIFTLIWFIWYYAKIREEKKQVEKLKEKWK